MSSVTDKHLEINKQKRCHEKGNLSEQGKPVCEMAQA